MALSLTPAVGESPDPIFESPANRFLISKLGCKLPMSYSFSTITHYGLRIRTFTFCRIIDDRVIRYRFLAMWTYDLVSHLLSFLGKLESSLTYCYQAGGLPAIERLPNLVGFSFGVAKSYFLSFHRQ
jgi:hypothetical protein